MLYLAHRVVVVAALVVEEASAAVLAAEVPVGAAHPEAGNAPSGVVAQVVAIALCAAGSQMNGRETEV